MKTEPIDVAELLKREKLNTAMSAARLFYRRGQLEDALRQCRDVLEIDEQNAEAHELIGDILRDQNKTDAALEEFRKALEIDPNLGSAEEKIGIISIERDGLMRFDQRRMELASDATKRKFEERNPAIAGTLSFLLPGAGQWYNEDMPRALAVFAIVGITLAFFLIPIAAVIREVNAAYPDLGRREELPSLGMLSEQLEQKSAIYLLWILFNGLMCGVVWTYGIIEATITAVHSNRRLRKHLGIE